MCARWRDEERGTKIIQGIQVILYEIGSSVSLHGENGITYSDLRFQLRYRPTLVSAIRFHPDVPGSQKEGIVTSGLVDALRKGELNPTAVLAAISAEEHDFLRKKFEEFVLVTSISLRNLPPFRTISGIGSKIILSKRLPKKYKRPEAERRLQSCVPGPLPHDYITVLAQTRGRSEDEAAANALDSLSLLIGIWNFLITSSSMTVSLRGQTSVGQLAAVRLGPLHTLHHPDGALATDTFWFDSDYTLPTPVLRETLDFKKIRNVEKWIMRQVSRAKHGVWLCHAFRKYAAAVQEPKLENGFLRFWSLLEYLTKTEKEERSDIMISRVAATYDDSRFVKQELHYLRNVRNDFVHRSESSDYPQYHAYQLKKYVDDFIKFLLPNINGKRKLSEIISVLDLPTDLNELRRKRELYGLAIKFRTPRPVKNKAKK